MHLPIETNFPTHSGLESDLITRSCPHASMSTMPTVPVLPQELWSLVVDNIHDCTPTSAILLVASSATSR